MARFNNGLIYTNDNCIGCNKCVSSCPVLGATISVKNNDSYVIKIDERKCDNCGKCLRSCVHDAISYKDDVDSFLETLESGKNISLIVDPSFFILYGTKANYYLAYLKEKGVNHIYSSNLGKEISIWLNVNYVKNHSQDSLYQRAYITNSCSSMVNHFELFCPSLMNKIIPVHSEIMCTAIYARKYLNDLNDFAVLSPCTSKNDYIKVHDSDTLVDFNLLYSKLVKKIDSKISSSPYFDLEKDSFGLKDFIPILEETDISYSYFFSPWEGVKRFENINEENIHELEKLNYGENSELRPIIAVFTDCTKGCRRGPALEDMCIDDKQADLVYGKINRKALQDYKNSQDYENNFTKMNSLFASLNPNDFTCKIESRYKQQPIVPDTTYDEIYAAMYKDSDEKRNIDCGSCGYKSCHEMAKAIAYGYNKKENCIHYMNEEMHLRSSVDSQTGLLTKDAFIAAATTLLSDNIDKKYLICAGDINRFKIIDELFGSKVGDEVLLRIAEKLKEIVGEEGYCGRLYGGSFVLCFEYTLDNYNRFRSTFRNSEENNWLDFSDFGINFPITMRFGLCESFDDNYKIDELISYATLARDEKKEINKNSLKTTFTLFSEELKNNIEHEAEITAAMKPALKNNEFCLWYQPQYYTNSKKLAGAEALCRWVKSDGTIIPPSEFIPIAEKNGFIKELDEYNWKNAFETVRKWKQQGLNTVPISVNISRISFRDDKLIPVIESLRKEYSEIKDEIHFEVTESIDMGDQAKLIERINSLKAIGIKLAMDDFGSGYSSLNTLKDLDIDYLKLDMGFLEERNVLLRQNNGDSSKNINRGEEIITSMIQMAKKINIATIAEGVETASQQQFMEKIGCNVIQGYIWGKPVPEEEFIKKMIIGKVEDSSEVNNKVEEKPLVSCVNEVTENNEISQTLSDNNSISVKNNEEVSGLKQPKCMIYLRFNVLDLKNSLELSIIEVNKDFCLMTGFDENTILNWKKKQLMERVSSEDLKIVTMKAIKNLIHKWDEPFSLEYKVCRANGQLEKEKINVKCIKHEKDNYILYATFDVL